MSGKIDGPAEFVENRNPFYTKSVKKYAKEKKQ